MGERTCLLHGPADPTVLNGHRNQWSELGIDSVGCESALDSANLSISPNFTSAEPRLGAGTWGARVGQRVLPSPLFGSRCTESTHHRFALQVFTGCIYIYEINKIYNKCCNIFQLGCAGRERSQLLAPPEQHIKKAAGKGQCKYTCRILGACRVVRGGLCVGRTTTLPSYCCP